MKSMKDKAALSRTCRFMRNLVGATLGGFRQHARRQNSARFPRAAGYRCALLIAVSLSALPTIAQAQFPIPQFQNMRPSLAAMQSASQAAPSAANTPHPAVARITVKERNATSYGSGSLVDVQGEFGLVVTNWHVVRDAAGEITVQFPDGFRSPAQVVKTDADWDLAALSIYRPKDVAPLAISPLLAQRGEPLAIAGYGSGDYRAVAGQCTQYVAPGENFPYELLEISVEARQGDSGGPILNQRGELAGVLFGAGRGFTTGSYGGRVQQFLTSVIPARSGNAIPSVIAANAPATMPPSAPPQPFAAQVGPPASASPSFATAPIAPELPQATALHEETPKKQNPFEPLDLAPVDVSPVDVAASDALMPVPQRGARAAGFDEENSTWEDSRAATLDRLASNSREIDLLSPRGRCESDDEAFERPRLGTIHTSLPPRGGLTASGPDLNNAPPDQLLAAAWAKLGGNTFFDQAKTILAIVGILCLMIQFWRFNSTPEPVAHDE
jgi:S1-C subfamily serine protease